ncbi:hypothetical protein [Alteromonas halophila]|uniref:Uncharacterized protein n=1 Tax=Alteromonas halophila TaxID=516698 RepID=A0A918JJS1_9ALTE|nr:hypothetical protein [Alteromonas halophila]GGW83580.1 hypothetical protein GCM10007391_16400 [Alteromonas halophila]
MLNRWLAVIALFIAIAAYQFGYYQGRLSLSMHEPGRADKSLATTVISAGQQLELPPVSLRCAKDAPASPPPHRGISSPVTDRAAVE